MKGTAMHITTMQKCEWAIDMNTFFLQILHSLIHLFLCNTIYVFFVGFSDFLGCPYIALRECDDYFQVFSYHSDFILHILVMSKINSTFNAAYTHCLLCQNHTTMDSGLENMLLLISLVKHTVFVKGSQQWQCIPPRFWDTLRLVDAHILSYFTNRFFALSSIYSTFIWISEVTLVNQETRHFIDHQMPVSYEWSNHVQMQ